MTKYELTSKVAKQSGLTHEQVRKCLFGLLHVIKETLAEEQKISIRGLGIFRLEETKERIGYNIHTKLPINIPSRKIVRFKMCSWLMNLNKSF